MADFSATTVKELRAKTGAGIMDCKEALAVNNGNISAVRYEHYLSMLEEIKKEQITKKTLVSTATKDIRISYQPSKKLPRKKEKTKESPLAFFLISNNLGISYAQSGILFACTMRALLFLQP